MALGRNEKLHVSCENHPYLRCEKCPKQRAKCAVAIKTDGDAARRANRLDDAMKQYKRALFAEPKFAEAWCDLAYIYALKSEYNNALSTLSKALAIDPQYGTAMYGKAVTLIRLGKRDAAMALIREILELYDDADVKELKEKLQRAGVSDPAGAYSLRQAGGKMTNKGDETITANKLQEKEKENRSALEQRLEKLAESAVNYADPPEDYADPPGGDGVYCCVQAPEEVPLFFRCDGCGKITCIQVHAGEEKRIIEQYRAVAEEFTRLGYPAAMKCCCDQCADQKFPSSNTYRNNFVFSVARPDREEPVNSFPETSFFSDTKYKVALAFLKGADTLTELSAATKTNLSARRYLDDVHDVLGGMGTGTDGR